MKAIYNTKNNIIRMILDSTDPSKYLEKNEDYKAFPHNANIKENTDIRIYDTEGRLRPNSELLADNLITLGEDQILDGEVIRPLTEEELKVKYPERYPTAEDLALAEELATIEIEIKAMEDEALKSLIQSRLNEEI